MYPDIYICTEYDEFLQNEDKPIWIAELEDGKRVYCDDGRYGKDDIAWYRLRKNIEVTKNNIEKLYIKFRSHTELVAQRTELTKGFYFRRGAGAWIGQPTVNYMITGTVEGHPSPSCGLYVKSVKWRVPEIHKEEEEIRDCGELDSIIWDKK